jgi:hypothetical protein
LNIDRAKAAIGKVMKIAFKERRTSVTDADREERKNIAVKALEEAQESRYDFLVTQAQFKDAHDGVIF